MERFTKPRVSEPLGLNCNQLLHCDAIGKVKTRGPRRTVFEKRKKVRHYANLSTPFGPIAATEGISDNTDPWNS